MQSRSNQFLRNLVWSILGLVLITPPIAAAADLFFPSSKIVYQQYGHSISEIPTQQQIEGVKSSEHGSYERRTFYVFVKSHDGKKMLISDGGLQAVLTPVAGSQKPNKARNISVQYAMTFEKGTDEVRAIQGATVTINHDSCGEHACFVVQGTGNLTDLPSGGKSSFDNYRVVTPLPDKKGKGQPFSDIFVHKLPTFNLIRGCWDITNVSMVDFQQKGCKFKGELFNLPKDNSLNYTQKENDVIVPYGWLYASKAGGESTLHSNMISSSADVMNSVQKSTGFNFSSNVTGGAEGIFSVNAEFSMTQNKDVADKIDQMCTNETTYSEHKYIETRYALLDKLNVSLTQGLADAIENIKNNSNEENLKAFLENWGTHYAHAATLGAKGSAVRKYSKQQIKQMIDKQVNLEQAWSAGVSATVFGVGGGVKGGQTSKSAQENQNNWESITGKEFEDIKCVGGLSCHAGGEVSAGAWVPIFVDLRPISELLGPPFYRDVETAVVLKNKLAADIDDYAFEKPDSSHSGVAIQQAVKLTINKVTFDRAGGATPASPDVTDIYLEFDNMDVLLFSGALPGCTVPTDNQLDGLQPDTILQPNSRVTQITDVAAVSRYSAFKRGSLCANPNGGTSVTYYTDKNSSHFGPAAISRVLMTHSPPVEQSAFKNFNFYETDGGIIPLTENPTSTVLFRFMTNYESVSIGRHQIQNLFSFQQIPLDEILGLDQ